MLSNDSRCPCLSGMIYGECCGRFHAGALAPSAEALMRARYSAFVSEDVNFLLASWHPSRRPKQLSLAENPVWQQLEILAVTGSPFADRATVEFNAHYYSGGVRGVLHENSIFVREKGQWLYLGAQ